MEKLFQLIKSLSKSEKRYFKIHASKHSIRGQNSYVRLFNVIDKMQVFEEKAIKEALKNDKFISSTKNYLFSTILKVLADFNSSGSIRREINKIVDEYQVLTDKGMFADAAKRIKKAKEMAISKEMLELALDILNMELNLYTRMNYSKKVYELYVKNKDEKEEIAEKLKVFNELNFIYNRLSVIWQKDKSPDSEDLKWINKFIFNNPLFTDEKNAGSKKGKALFFRILLIAHEIKMEFQISYIYMQKYIKHADENPELLNVYTSHYLQILTNMISTELYMEKFKEAEQNIKKLKTLPNLLLKEKRTQNIEANIIYYTYYLTLVLCLETVQIEKGIDLIKEIEQKLKHYSEHMLKYKVVQLYFFFAYLYYLKSDFDNSLKYINKILSDEESDISPDIISFNRIIRLIIYYEKQDYEFIEYLLSTTKRFLKKRDRAYKFESLLIEFFRRAVNEKNEHDQLLSTLMKKLKELKNDAYEWEAIGKLDLFAWIESRLTNKPIIEILKQESTSAKPSSLYQ
jgi:hypothetical protein